MLYSVEQRDFSFLLKFINIVQPIACGLNEICKERGIIKQKNSYYYNKPSTLNQDIMQFMYTPLN